MATDTEQPQQPPSLPLQPTSQPATPAVSAPLHQRIAQYKGKSFALLVYMLKEPDAYWADACRTVGVNTAYSYDLRKQPGYEALLQEIRSHAGDLRSEYAQAAMRDAIPSVVDKMIAAASGDGRDAQRARERILETVGVLPKGNEQLQAAPIQVVTHTYVLVQPSASSAQGAIVESSARELPAPQQGS